jgi:protocatechuate 3,4-dioxygenase beta subunit
MAGAALTVAGQGVAAAEESVDCAVDCIAKPEATEGPYFVDEGLNRSDVRPDPSNGSVTEGALLTLNIGVLRIESGGCAPLKDAVVDIWSCDSLGLYSDVAAEGTVGKKFLRGYQVTNRTGKVRFLTVLPGWYSGRTIHLHVKVRTTGTDGNPYEFTSQLYFTEEFKAGYLTKEPYAGKGLPDTTNAADRFFAAGGGDQMLLRPRRMLSGYVADFAIGLDLSDTAVGDDDAWTRPPTPAPS